MAFDLREKLVEVVCNSAGEDFDGGCPHSDLRGALMWHFQAGQGNVVVVDPECGGAEVTVQAFIVELEVGCCVVCGGGAEEMGKPTELRVGE
jgi:hypothetical protein